MNFALHIKTPLIEHKMFPSTRYQGSKRKLVPHLFEVFSQHKFSRALDLYSGTATVSLLLRYMGKSVHSNDMLSFNRNNSFLFLNATPPFLRLRRHESVIRELLYDKPLRSDPIISDVYKGIFFKDEENIQVDRFCQNVVGLPPLDRALYIYCVGQSLLMKRPYSLFHRSNLDMRTRDVERSFGNAKTWETPIVEHSVNLLHNLRKFPFPENITPNETTCWDADRIELFEDSYEIVYLDPPYLNKKGQGVDYCDFYHFLEGLVDYSLFGQADISYPHRPIVKGRSAWLSVDGATKHLSCIVEKFRSAIFVLSYRLDGRPTADDLTQVFSNQGRELKEASSARYKYALSKSTETQEAILVSLPADKM